METIIKKKTNLHDLQKIMYDRGELCNESIVVTKHENKLGQALIDSDIQVIPDFKVNGKSFDFKLFHYPILIEVDGGYHKEEQPRLRDYQKDRRAQKHGFKVMRFTNFEINNSLNGCIDEIKSMIKKTGHSPREIWLFEYTLIDKIRDWWRRKKPSKPITIPGRS